MKIPDNTKIQSFDLRIKDLNVSLNFYSELLGFKVIEMNEGYALLSANGNLPYLIKLVEDKNALSISENSPGLFHVAFRFKNRKELGRVFMRLFKNNMKFKGFSDHIVSEAIYLSDPDGNGIELYTDKPKDDWNGIDPETDIGHIHIKVTDLLKSEKFYSLILGMNVTSSLYPGALFYSAGGYHHHIGTNNWFSKNGKVSKEISLGLIDFTVKIPDVEYVKMISGKAEEDGLLIEKLNGDKESIVLKDFDGNVMKIES